jgi:hypothetical protein
MSAESHFVEEHIEQAAYMHARGRSWAVIANDLKHHDADRLRRAMRREPLWNALLNDARKELAEECEAEGVMILRAQIRDDDKARTLEAATKLIEFAERIAARQHALELEQFKAAERARLQKERLDRLAELQQKRIDAAAALLDKRLAAQVKVETERAQMRTALGLGLPATEKAKAKRLQEDLYHEARFHASNQRATARMASAAARDEELVWLPGGAHNIGFGEVPGMEDTPFRLISDCVNGRTIYWLVDSQPAIMFPPTPDPAQRMTWTPDT